MNEKEYKKYGKGCRKCDTCYNINCFSHPNWMWWFLFSYLNETGLQWKRYTKKILINLSNYIELDLIILLLFHLVVGTIFNYQYKKRIYLCCTSIINWMRTRTCPSTTARACNNLVRSTWFSFLFALTKGITIRKIEIIIKWFLY